MARTANPRGQGARLRGELLDAASRLLAAGGRDAELTLRGVAREAGVSAPSVYAHFADLDELAVELVRRHVADLATALHRSASRTTSRPAPDRLRSLARAYVRWGLENPGPYTVVFEGRALRQLSAEDERALTAGSDLLGDLAALLVDLDPAPADPAVAALGVWTALHGVVSLRLSKPAYPWPGVERHVDAALGAVVPGRHARAGS
jgi:AcrR family transcriptional regulator